MTNSEQLAGDLSSIATLVRERMAQSEEAASNIKQAAEAINTAQNNQDYLKGNVTNLFCFPPSPQKFFMPPLKKCVVL